MQLRHQRNCATYRDALFQCNAEKIDEVVLEKKHTFDVDDAEQLVRTFVRKRSLSIQILCFADRLCFTHLSPSMMGTFKEFVPYHRIRLFYLSRYNSLLVVLGVESFRFRKSVYLVILCESLKDILKLHDIISVAHELISSSPQENPEQTVPYTVLDSFQRENCSIPVFGKNKPLNPDSMRRLTFRDCRSRPRQSRSLGMMESLDCDSRSHVTMRPTSISCDKVNGLRIRNNNMPMEVTVTRTHRIPQAEVKRELRHTRSISPFHFHQKNAIDLLRSLPQHMENNSPS